MSKTYLIELIPLGRFFFGGEKTFGTTGNENYLIKSERYPQQTTLLGMLRQVILEQCGLLTAPGWTISNNEQAAQVIGPKSFHLNGTHAALDFGVIQRLSPVFLMKNKERYYPCPFDSGFTLGFTEGLTLFSNAGGEREQIPLLHGYNPKRGIEKKWISQSGETIDEDNIFFICEKPGVWKSGEGEEDEQGYYKQNFLKINKNWSFSFFAELDENLISESLQKHYGDLLQSTHVTFGKERSSYRMEVTTRDGTLDELYFPANLIQQQQAGDWHKIVLLSDTFVDNSIYSDCFFAVAETKDFRFLKTEVERTNWYANVGHEHNGGVPVVKSEKYNLLRRGSVLYTSNPEKVKEHLDKKLFRQTGYNYYGVMNAYFNSPTPYEQIL